MWTTLLSQDKIFIFLQKDFIKGEGSYSFLLFNKESKVWCNIDVKEIISVQKGGNFLMKLESV